MCPATPPARQACVTHNINEHQQQVIGVCKQLGMMSLAADVLGDINSRSLLPGCNLITLAWLQLDHSCLAAT
jgi:hypothetical protein